MAICFHGKDVTCDMVSPDHADAMGFIEAKLHSITRMYLNGIISKDDARQSARLDLIEIRENALDELRYGEADTLNDIIELLTLISWGKDYFRASDL